MCVETGDDDDGWQWQAACRRSSLASRTKPTCARHGQEQLGNPMRCGGTPHTTRQPSPHMFNREAAPPGPRGWLQEPPAFIHSPTTDPRAQAKRGGSPPLWSMARDSSKQQSRGGPAVTTAGRCRNISSGREREEAESSSLQCPPS
jgi:hypothetical protein